MNRLIAVLQAENNLSILRLKQVFRKFCKKSHPDITKGNGEDFIRLRREYEEAVIYLSRIEKPHKREQNPFVIENPRETVLEYLYLFSLKIFSEDGEKILRKMIEASSQYNDRVHDLLTDYYESLYQNHSAWMDDGNVFYTHNLFISAVRHLFQYYSTGKTYSKTNLLKDLKDLESRTLKMKAVHREILLGLANWLKEEIEGEKIVVC